MKFGHTFKDSLQAGDFPLLWVELAVPYQQLKKCLKNLRRELDEFGLDQQTLRELLTSHPSSDDTAGVGVTYKLFHDVANSAHLRPRLTADIRLRDGIPVNASLSGESRQFLENITTKQQPSPFLDCGSPPNVQVGRNRGEGRPSHDSTASAAAPELEHSVVNCSREDGIEIKQVTVPLTFDAKFFDILQGDVAKLDTLQSEVQTATTGEIIALGSEVATLSGPKSISRSDMNRWRAIFELYLEAGVFFSTHEQDTGMRSSGDALKQLQWFQSEVQKKGLDAKFKLKQSSSALARFVEVNSTLIRYLQFQEMNQLAISKILKKFDKRTSLGAGQVFPEAIHAQSTLAGSISKDLCAEISTRVVSLVPQINDYLCPVCQELAYRSVRLNCNHLFCVRCIGKLLRRGAKDCPVCRREVLRQVTLENVDFKLERFLKKYFPKEAREKNRANQLERGIEVYGEDFKPLPDPCHLM